MIDLETARCAYAERFGALFEAREVIENGAAFWLLCFWTPGGGAPAVYATLGAPGREIHLASRIPFRPMGNAVTEAALKGTGRSSSTGGAPDPRAEHAFRRTAYDAAGGRDLRPGLGSPRDPGRADHDG